MNISTGEPATLETYLRLASKCFGSGGAVAYIENQISRAPAGKDTFITTNELEVFNLMAQAQTQLNKNVADLTFAPPPDPWIEYMMEKHKE